MSVVMTVVGTHTLASAEQPTPAKRIQQEDLQLPVYTPPKKLTPRARVGGTLRGSDGHEPELVALVPDHVGLTVKQTPTLNWYLSKPTTYPLRFTLNDTQKVAPLYEGPPSHSDQGRSPIH